MNFDHVDLFETSHEYQIHQTKPEYILQHTI